MTFARELTRLSRVRSSREDLGWQAKASCSRRVAEGPACSCLQESAALQGPDALTDLRRKCCHFAQGDQHGQRPATPEGHAPADSPSRSSGDPAAMLRQMGAPPGEVHIAGTASCVARPMAVLCSITGQSVTSCAGHRSLAAVLRHRQAPSGGQSGSATDPAGSHLQCPAAAMHRSVSTHAPHGTLMASLQTGTLR